MKIMLCVRFTIYLLYVHYYVLHLQAQRLINSMGAIYCCGLIGYHDSAMDGVLVIMIQL